MRLPKLSTFVAPLLAFCITTSAMIVTVDASAAQDEINPVPAPAVEVAPIDAAPIADPDLPPVPEQAVDPASVLHNRQHHVSLDANGGFTGQLITLSSADGTPSPASGMKISIIRSGSVVTSAMTDAEGTFNVSGVGEGVVSICGTSGSALLLFSVHLENDGNVIAEATPVKLETEAIEIGLYTAVVGPSDLATVKQLILGALPPGDYRFGSDASDEDNEFPMGENEGSTSISHHAVQLQADGSLKGQVNVLDPRNGRHRDVQDLMLHFVRNGQHVGATEVQTDGSFSMSGLTAGTYSIATTGRDGILAMGIHVVGALAQAEKQDEFKLTSISQALDLAVSPTNPGDINAQNGPPLLEDEPSPAGEGGEMPLAGAAPLGGPAGGAPGGGSGGGGGGGPGGGGGLAALLGAAGAAAIGYAAGDKKASPKR